MMLTVEEHTGICFKVQRLIDCFSSQRHDRLTSADLQMGWDQRRGQGNMTEGHEQPKQ